jgi:hypothetical protein
MTRLLLLAAIALGAAVTATATAAPSRPVITVTPSHVHRGNTVTISGNAGTCPVGDTVILMSRAFHTGNHFAGVPAVLTKVRARHRFHATTRITPATRTGRYTVTGRCGGGNLGVSASLVVLR